MDFKTDTSFKECPSSSTLYLASLALINSALPLAASILEDPVDLGVATESNCQFLATVVSKTTLFSPSNPSNLGEKV